MHVYLNIYVSVTFPVYRKESLVILGMVLGSQGPTFMAYFVPKVPYTKSESF